MTGSKIRQFCESRVDGFDHKRVYVGVTTEVDGVQVYQRAGGDDAALRGVPPYGRGKGRPVGPNEVSGRTQSGGFGVGAITCICFSFVKVVTATGESTEVIVSTLTSLERDMQMFQREAVQQASQYSEEALGR